MSNVDIELSAGLNIDQSVQQIKTDIASIQKRLDSARIKIDLKAEILDEELKKSLSKIGNTNETAVIGKKMGDNLATNLINAYNIKSKEAQRQIKSSMNQLYNMTLGEVKSGSENPQFISTLDKLGNVIINNANIMQSRMGIYDEFYKYFKGISKIKIPDIVRQDLGKDWNSMRMVSAKTFTTKSGTELDSIYQELSDKFKEHFSGTADPTEQFREIVNAVKAYREDIDRLEPVDLSKMTKIEPSNMTEFEGNVWDTLISDLGTLRSQIKAQLPQIEAEVAQSAQNIKKSLLNIGVSFDNGNIEDLTKDVTTYFKSIAGIEDKDIDLKFFKNADEEVTRFTATLNKGQGEIEKYNFSLNSMGQYAYSGGSLIDKSGKEFSDVALKAAEFQTKLESLKRTYQSFLTGDSASNPFKALVDGIDFTNITDRSSLDEMISKFQQATEQAKLFNYSLSNTGAAKKLDQYLKELPADLDYLESKFQGAKFKMPDDTVQSFVSMRSLLAQINKTDDPTQKIALYNQLSEQLNKTTQRYKQLTQEQKNSSSASKLQDSKNLFETKVNTWMNQNTAAVKAFSDRLSDLKSKLSSADSTEFPHLKAEFQSIQAEAKQMGLTGSKAAQQMKSEFQSAVTSVMSLTAAFQTFKQMVGTARNIDDALFNLQVATGQTREETKGLIDTYNQMAKELGSTTTQIAEGADAWLRQGKSIEEANILIKDSMILSKIGMIDASDATENLTAVLNGYKMSAESALAVVSKLSAVDLESASDAGGLAESMSRTATSASLAGISLDQLIGIIATLKDVTQSGDEEIGNAVKSIVARYSQIKANKFVDYETGEDLSNVESVLGKIGVKIRDNLTDYRDLGDVLQDVAEKYSSLNDVERNAVNTAMFGTYQQNKGAVLLSNWDKVQKLTQVSANSSDEALEKFSAYTDTVQAHINSLTASYEHLASVIANSEFLKGAADAASGFLDVISALIDKLGLLSVATGAITGGAALKGINLGAFDNNGSEITFLGKTMEEMQQASAAGEKFGGIFTSKVKEPISNAQSVISNYNMLVQKQCVSQEAINKLTDDMDMKKYLSSLKGTEAGMEGYTNALNMTAAASLKLKLQTVALNMALNMGLTAAISAAIWAIGTAYDAVANRTENLKNAANEASDEYEELKSDVESINDELKTTGSRIDELNSKDHLSFTEQEELDRLKETNEELERELRNKKALLNIAEDDAHDKAVDYFNSKPKGMTRYTGWDETQVEAGNERYGTAKEDVYSGSQLDVAKQQLEDYKSLLEEQKQVEQEILDFQTEHPKDYMNMDAYTDLEMHSKYVKDQLSTLKSTLSDTMTDFQKFDGSLDVEKDKELLGILKEISTLFQQLFGGVSPEEGFKSVWDSDSFRSQKEELEKMASAGTLDESTLSNNERYRQLLDATGKTAKETCDHIYSLVQAEKEQGNVSAPFTKSEMISQINSLSEGFEELDKVMTSIKKKDDVFDYSILDNKNFKENFSGFTTEYNDFVNTVSENPKNIQACQEAFDNLATAFLYNSDVLDGLSDDTANVTTKYLELMGVQNSEEIVSANLAATHAEAAWNAQDLTNATAEEIQQLAAESEQTEVGRQAFAAYIAQKLINSVIDTSGDISALAAEVSQLGISINAWRQYYAAKKDMAALAGATQQTDASGYKSKSVMVDRATGNALTLKDGKYYNADGTLHKGAKYNRIISNLAEEQIQKTATSFEKNLLADIAPVKGYTGPKSTNPSVSKGAGGGNKGNKSSAPKENSTIDWISRSAELLERKSEELKTAISDTWTAYTGLSEEDIKRVQELFSLPFDPNSNEAQELLDYANRLGVSLEELKNLSENNGLESRQSLYQQLMVVDQSRLDQANQSLDYYKQSYEDLVSKVPEYRDKIENGGIDIESMTGDQKTNVENAMKAYDSYLDSQKNAKEIQKQLREDKSSYYEQIIEQATKENERLSSNNDLIQKQIDLLKARGNIVDASTYETMIGNTKTQISNTKSVIKSRKKKLDAAMDEGLEVGDEEWYELTKSISDAEGELLDLEEQQAEYNKQLKEMPITNMTTVINMYKDISTAIQNWGAELEASGTALTADYYQELIKNGSTIISEYKEQASIIKDVMDTYDVGSDNWNELYSQLQNVNGEMSSMIQNLKKWNEELLQLPLTKISDYSSDLNTVKDALTALQDDYSTVISAVTGAIDDETKAIQDQQKEFQKNIEKQKDAIQDKIDLLDKQNTKLQLQNQLEQAAYDLQIANTQKTQKIIRNGEEIYVTDADKIREAQKAYQDAQFSKTKNDLQEQLDALNDQLDDYNDKVDEQLEALDKIKDKWSEIAENVTKAQNAMVANDYLGSGWKDKVLSGNDADIYNAFKNQYEQNASQLKAYEDQIQSTERIYNLLNSYIEAYKAGTITANEAYSQIDRLLSQLNDGLISADANLMNVLQYSKDITGASGSSAEQVLAGIKDDLKTSGQDLLASLRQYEENSKLIGEQTTSWQQLTKDVSEMLSVLKDVKKALKESERDDDDEDEDDDSSSKKKHHSKSDGPGKSAWSNKDENNGPGAEINRKKAGIAHSGLEAGVVGKSTEDSEEAWMKSMGLKELDPKEYPYILKAGEQIVNDEQRRTLMSNFNNAYSSAYADGIKRGINAAASAMNQVNNNTYTVNAPIGKIVLENVQNSQDLAEDLMNNFKMTMAQQFSKFYR